VSSDEHLDFVMQNLEKRHKTDHLWHFFRISCCFPSFSLVIVDFRAIASATQCLKPHQV